VAVKYSIEVRPTVPARLLPYGFDMEEFELEVLAEECDPDPTIASVSGKTHTYTDCNTTIFLVTIKGCFYVKVLLSEQEVQHQDRLEVGGQVKVETKVKVMVKVKTKVKVIVKVKFKAKFKVRVKVKAKVKVRVKDKEVQDQVKVVIYKQNRRTLNHHMCLVHPEY